MYIVIDKATRQVFATEAAEPPGNAYARHYVLETSTPYALGAVLTSEQLMELATAHRALKVEKLLARCERTQFEHYPKQSKKQKWKTYIQALYAVLEQADPLNPVWPTPPSEPLIPMSLSRRL